MKNYGLDERQNGLADKAGSFSFKVMFFLSVITILVQLILDKNFEVVIGETIVLVIGTIVYFIAMIKNGLWTSWKNGASLCKNAICSIFFSGIFSVIFVFTISQKTTHFNLAIKAGIYFFIAISILAFAVVTLLEKLAFFKKEKAEKEYEE